VNVANFAEPGSGSYTAELDKQARRKGVRPIASVDELRADVFETDEELEDLLAGLDEFRHSSVDWYHI
jgi:hypothetical protein